MHSVKNCCWNDVRYTTIITKYTSQECSIDVLHRKKIQKDFEVSLKIQSLIKMVNKVEAGIILILESFRSMLLLVTESRFETSNRDAFKVNNKILCWQWNFDVSAKVFKLSQRRSGSLGEVRVPSSFNKYFLVLGNGICILIVKVSGFKEL